LQPLVGRVADKHTQTLEGSSQWQCDLFLFNHQQQPVVCDGHHGSDSAGK